MVKAALDIIFIGAYLTGLVFWKILTFPYWGVRYLLTTYFPKFRNGEYCWVKGEEHYGPVVIMQCRPRFIGSERQYRVAHHEILPIYNNFPKLRANFEDVLTSFVGERQLRKLTILEKILYL